MQLIINGYCNGVEFSKFFEISTKLTNIMDGNQYLRDISLTFHTISNNESLYHHNYQLLVSD